MRLITASKGMKTTQFHGGVRPSYKRPAFPITRFITLPIIIDITMTRRNAVEIRRAQSTRHTSTPTKRNTNWSRNHWRKRGPIQRGQRNAGTCAKSGLTDCR